MTDDTRPLADDEIACRWCGQPVPGGSMAVEVASPGRPTPAGEGPGMAWRLGECDGCAGLADRADVLAGQLGTDAASAERVLCAAAALGREPCGPLLDAAGDLLHPSWEMLARTDPVTHAARCAAHPWAHVTDDDVARLRASVAKATADRARGRPRGPASPPRGDGTVGSVDAGCLVCGRPESPRWVGFDEPAGHFGVTARQRVTVRGSLCPRCADAVDGCAWPGEAIAACLRAAGVDVPADVDLARPRLACFAGRVVSARLAGAVEPAPPAEPFGWVSGVDVADVEGTAGQRWVARAEAEQARDAGDLRERLAELERQVGGGS